MWYLVAVLLNIVMRGTVLAVPLCKKHSNQTDEPIFTRTLGTIDYVRVSHAIPILCCADGYTNITWSRMENKRWVNFPPPTDGDYNTPVLEEDRQILRILDAQPSDETNYSCEVIGKTKTKTHITQLVFIHCDPRPAGPLLISPNQENKTITEYGGNVTFHCTGYFGCQDKGNWPEQLAFWTVDGNNVTHVSPRYTVEIVSNYTWFKKEAILTVTNVNEEDTKKTFHCRLANPQLHQVDKPVRIVKQDMPKFPVLMIALIAGGSVLFLIVIVISVLSLRCLYGPQIRLFCSSRISALGPRTIDRETFWYNIFIYHDDEDEEMAHTIKKELQDRSYDVYIMADMGGNQHVMNTVFEKCRRSAMVLFLYSDALRENHLANFVLQSLISERREMDIMFLEVAKYEPEEVRDWTLHAKDRNELREEYGLDGRLEHYINGNETAETGLGSIAEMDGLERKNDNEKTDKTTDKKKEIVEDLKFWKVLPRIKFPESTANNRKMANFWCHFQNQIPKFGDQRRLLKNKKKQKDRKNSANTPLLENGIDIEQLSPNRHSNTSTQGTPSTNEVFAFGKIESEQYLQSIFNEDIPVENILRPDIDKTEDTFPERVNVPYCINSGTPVRSELTRDNTETNRASILVCAKDVHHKKSIAPVLNTTSSTPKSVEMQTGEYLDAEDVNGKNILRSREEIFTMSDEERKLSSFRSETGFTDENSSGIGTQYNSESGESSRHELLSYNSSSGVSEFNSECSQSPQIQFSEYTNIDSTGYTEFPGIYNDAESMQAPAYNAVTSSDSAKSKGKGDLNLRINPPAMGIPISSSPDSGCITSTSERVLSTGGFPLHGERKIDVIVEEH